jgi:hypothetical protein
VLQNKITPKATEVSGSKQLSTPIKWTDSVKNNKPLPCIGQEIDCSNNLHSSNDKHIEIEVHEHKFMIQFAL